MDQEIQSTERQFAILCHLGGGLGGALGGALYGGCLFFLPIGIGVSLFIPWIIWLMKRRESSWISLHSREVLNFQFNLIGLYLLLYILTVLMAISHGDSLTGIVWMIAVYAILILPPLVFGCIGAVKASKDELFQYPRLIRFL